MNIMKAAKKKIKNKKSEKRDSIYCTSASGYKQLSNSKLSFQKRHHISTLKKYEDCTKPTFGLNADILKELMTKSKLDSLLRFF